MEIAALPNDKKIILFDGVCNLCDSSVQFVIKHDKKDVFRFVPLQSELGQKIIGSINIPALDMESVVLYEPEKGFSIKAEAAFKILKEVSTVYKILLIFSILPNAVLNFLYDYVAKNRYLWFGKKESCMIPSSDLAIKFLA